MMLSVEFTLDLGIAYFAMLIMALIPIYIGAHLSLHQKGVILKNDQILYIKEPSQVHNVTCFFSFCITRKENNCLIRWNPCLQTMHGSFQLLEAAFYLECIFYSRCFQRNTLICYWRDTFCCLESWQWLEVLSMQLPLFSLNLWNLGNFLSIHPGKPKVTQSG
jgi:hypothetical protein